MNLNTVTLLLNCVVLATSTYAEQAAATRSPARPNIIVILADDSGYSDLGCYGGEIDTPNLDRLAREGVRFTQFYNNGRCSPTRASLMTGRESAAVGFAAGTLGGWNREMEQLPYRARLPYETPTLPELLKASGYQTFLAGKWHLGGSLMKTGLDRPQQWKAQHPGWELTPEEIEADYNALPMQRGFDRFFGPVEGETHQFLVPDADAPGGKIPCTLSHNMYLDGNVPAKIEATRTYTMRCYSENKTRYPFHPSDGKTGLAWFATDGQTDAALDMINQAKEARQPFFLYLAYQSPHAPLQAPQALVDKYTARYADLGKVETDRVAGLIREKILPAGTDYKKTFSGTGKNNPAKAEQTRELAAIHAAMMENMDENIGRIVTRLREQGQLDSTLIVYLSDNGAASSLGDLMNKPYIGCKALLWEGGIRTAFIASWPGHIKPNTLNDTVGWVGDLLPTFLAAANVPFPKTFRNVPTTPPDGRNLLPALMGTAMPPPGYIFSNDKGQQGVVYQGRWKLLINPGWYALTRKNATTVYELYDLTTDPTETRNLATSQPEMVKQLATACEDWQKRSGILDYGELLKTRPDFSN